MAVARRSGQTEVVPELFAEMKAKGLKMDIVSWGQYIAGLCASGEIEAAEQAIVDMTAVRSFGIHSFIH
jgi:pentatricopeptide repeat protein